MQNKLELKENGKKVVYNILLTVDAKDNKYILYTKNEKNDVDEIIVYAGILNTVGSDVEISPVLDDDVLEYLDSVLIHVQNDAKKEVEE